MSAREDGGKEGDLGVMTAGRSSGRLESELENVCRELRLVEVKVAELLEQQNSLRARRDHLSGEIRARKKRCVLSQCDWAEENFEWSKPMAELLRDTFGLNGWRTNQKEIINATISSRDVFVVMRTGGGKSLCYQLPALLRGGITVVVSPLLSLIEDQTRYLNGLVPGSAAMLSAGMDKRETANVYRRMRGEKVEGDAEGSKLVMVLVTPEKVVKSKMFMAALDKTAQSGRLSRVVIDEAHCCSQWGHDFRPEYCKLGILKRQFGHVPILAVTATCTDFIRDDVMKILNLTPGDVVRFKSSFNRSNLRYSVMAKPEAAKDALDQLTSFIKDNYRGKAGIVYAFSRKEASDVANGLASRGVSAAFYHAGQEEQERSRVQQAWMRGDVPVIVATIAFGMGINHLEVRFVVHFSLSKSVENYYQESGRAGRDGKPSRCVVFYRPSDVSRQATLSCQDRGSQPLATLHKMVGYCQAMATCRRKMIAEALGEQGGKGLCDGGCDVCSGCAGAATNIDATRHATTLVRILRHLASKEQRVTPRQLVEAWRAKKGAKAMPDDVVGEGDRPNGLSRSNCERLVLQLLGMGVLSDDFHFTAFAVVHYVATGARAHALESGKIPQVLFQVPGGEGGPVEGRSKAKSNAAAVAAGRRGGGKGAAQREEEEDLDWEEASVANASAKDRLSGRRRGGVKSDRKREPDKKGTARGDQGKARKRPRPEADLRAAQCADAAGVVDLCGSGDDDSSIGFHGDVTEGGKRSRRILAAPEGEQDEEGGDASYAGGDDCGLDSNRGGRSVRAAGGSSSFASFDIDDDDSDDDFEPVRRKRKGVVRGEAAVEEDISS